MAAAPTDSSLHIRIDGHQGARRCSVGRLTKKRLYLIEGVPGSGKTTLALQFLMAGARAGEPVLYVTLSETEEELRVGRRLARLVVSTASRSGSWRRRKTALEPDEQIHDVPSVGDRAGRDDASGSWRMSSG